MNTAVEPSEAVGMSARRLERVGPAMQAYVDHGVYTGINTLIARRGKVVHAGAFGWRDKEAGSPMTADTIFRLYSMTKPVICTALMTLLEEGRFRLIEPLAKYERPQLPFRRGSGRRQNVHRSQAIGRPIYA
jgi:CubicO group peptidase (beta-lactamase class C family)